MKKLAILLFMIWVGTSFVFAAKKSKAPEAPTTETVTEVKTETKTETKTGSKYYVGTTGSDIKLAVPEARCKNIAEEQQYLGILLQTQLTDTIKKFSPMTVVDRQNEDIADSEIAKSEDGSYSDEDYAAFGKKLNAKYVAIAQIISMDEEFLLSVRIIETETNSIQFSYSKNVKSRELKNGTAINMAVKDILEEMGIQLTEEGKKAINGGVDENTLKAQENLSKGINASKRGTTIEAMQYYYAASEYNLDNSEISARLNAIQSAVSSGNLGDQARGEDEAFLYWQKTLKEADDYFTKNPPYEIAYSTKIERLKRTTEELRAQENSLQIEIGLLASNNSKNTIKALLSGISQSPAVVKEACSVWPKQSVVDNSNNTWMNAKSCTVTVQLINDVDKVIAERDVPLKLVGPTLMESRVANYNDLQNLVKVDLHNIQSADLTDTITIKIKSVTWDGKRLSTDYIRISTIEELREPLEAAMRAERERIAREEELKRIREQEEYLRRQRENEAKAKKDAKERKKAEHRAKHALSKRTAPFMTVDIPVNIYAGYAQYGMTFGYDHVLFGNLFWGFAGGLFMDMNENLSGNALGEIGISFGINPDTSIYAKFGIGGTSGMYPTGPGLLYRTAIGFDWTIFELEYSLDYAQGNFFCDRFVFGMVFPKAWYDSL